MSYSSEAERYWIASQHEKTKQKSQEYCYPELLSDEEDLSSSMRLSQLNKRQSEEQIIQERGLQISYILMKHGEENKQYESYSSHQLKRLPNLYFPRQIYNILSKQHHLTFQDQTISQQVLTYSSIGSILAKALSIFKLEIKNKLLSILNYAQKPHWNQLLEEHFEQQYVKDAGSNSISQIIRVYYDLMRGQSLVSQMKGHPGTVEQVFEKWLALAQEVNKTVLKQCLSVLDERTKNGVSTIEEVFSKISSRFYKARQYVIDNLMHTYLSRSNEFKLTSYQLIKSIQNGIDGAAKQILEALGLPNGRPISKHQKDTLLQLLALAAKIQTQNTTITPFYHLLIEYANLAFQDILESIRQKIISCVQAKLTYETDQGILLHTLELFRSRLDQLSPDFSHYFNLPIAEQIYSREYLQWFRGRHEQEKNLLYKKHYSMINYLALTRPVSVITYYRTFQSEANKRFDFYMERGNTNFINFESGYNYFRKLDLKEKIRYIMDIAEALMELHYHGITHNDVTLRNTVKVKDHYKIIDFDVARMARKNIDLRLYSQDDTQLIEHYRDQCIKCSSRLFKKQLKEQKLISQTNPKKVVTPVQNINRLSQYFALKSENQMILVMQSMENDEGKKRVLLSKEQKLKLLLSYENMVTGKRDCCTFGLMLLKLMHRSNGGFSLGTMDLMIKCFMKVLYSQKADDADYMELTDKFSLDKEVSADTQKSLLKLIARLMTPNLSKRIPMKLFALEFLSIMNISHYGLKIDADSIINRDIAYDTFIKQYNNKVNITSEANKIILFSLQPSTITNHHIQPIFNAIKQNLEQAKEHQMRVYNLLYKIKVDKQRPFDFEIEMIRAEQINAAYSLMQLIIEYKKKLQKRVVNILKELANKYFCLQHMKEALACCQSQKCQKKWLCLDCLHKCYRLPHEQRELSHCQKTIYISYHKIVHIHSKKEIKFAAKIYASYIYGCQDCIDDFWKYPLQRQFHMIDTSRRLLMDQLSLDTSQRKDPYLIDKRLNIYQNKISVDFHELVTSATTSIEQMRKENSNYITELIQTLKNKISQVNRQFGRCLDEIVPVLRRDPEYERLLKLSEFVKKMPRILELINGKSTRLEQYRHLLIELNQQVNIYSFFQQWEVRAEQYNAWVDRLFEDLQKTIEDGRKRRQKWKITNTNIYQMIKMRSSKTPIQIQRQASRMPSLFYMQKQVQRPEIQYRIKFFSDSSKDKLEDHYKIGSQQFELKDEESSPMSKIQMIDESFSGKSLAYDELCNKCIVKPSINNKIEYICLEKGCPSPLLCESCRPYDPHLNKIHLPSFTFKLQDQQQEEIFCFSKVEQRLSSSLQSENDIFLQDLKDQLVSHLNFIEKILCYNSNQANSIPQKIYDELKFALRNSNLVLFAELVYILNQLKDDPLGFMRVATYAVDNYISCLSQTILKIKALTKKWLDGRDRSPEKDNSCLLANKYKKVTGDGDNYKPKMFNLIPQRYHHLVEEVEINKLFKNRYEQTKNIDVQQMQLKNKMIRNGFNMFQIHLALKNYRCNPTFALETISKFNRLRKLVVVDTPHLHQLLHFGTQTNHSSESLSTVTYFNSLAIQQILSQAADLKQLTIKCFNGFDKYCLNQMASRKIKLEILSYRELSLQYYCLKRLFESNINDTLPFVICGEAIAELDSCNDLVTGQVRVDFTPLQWHHTLEQLHKMRQKQDKISAHYLQLYANSFSPLDDKISFNELYNYFLIQRSKDDYKQQISTIQNYLQQQTSRISSFFFEIQPIAIFTNVKYLSLYGIVLDSMGIKKNGYNEINQRIKKGVNWDALCHLQMKKCLGLSIDLISGTNLETLAIEDCLFLVEVDDNEYPTFENLRFLSLVNARTKGACKYHNLASYLQEFKLKHLKTLIINDSFSLVTEQLEWLTCTQLEYLSIRRCHLVTNEILSILKDIPTLKHIDLTSTLIKPYDLHYLAMNPTKCCMKNHIKEREAIGAWSMEELNRVATKYNIKTILQGYRHQSFPYESLLHFKSIKFLDQLFEQRRPFDFLRPLEALPQVQLIYFQNCRWISYQNFKRLIVQPMQAFPFLKSFEKLKELTIKNCQLKEFDPNLCSYQFLRRLNLSINHLTSISSMKFDNLIELDVSYNKLKEIELSHKTFPPLAVLNLYQNPVQSSGIDLQDYRSLRILYVQSDLARKLRLANSKDKKYIIYDQSFRSKGLNVNQRYQNICYIVAELQAVVSFWHLQMLLYNIEVDITQGITPIREESQEIYLLNRDIISKSKPSNLYNPRERSENPQFQRKIISNLSNKLHYYFNESSLRSQIKSLKQENYESLKQIQKNIYLAAKYLCENKPLNTMFQYQLEKQFLNKDDFSFVVLGEKGKRCDLPQIWSGGVWKGFKFIQTVHKTARALTEHNILHLRLQLSNFIQMESVADTFKFACIDNMLFLEEKHPLFPQTKCIILSAVESQSLGIIEYLFTPSTFSDLREGQITPKYQVLSAKISKLSQKTEASFKVIKEAVKSTQLIYEKFKTAEQIYNAKQLIVDKILHELKSSIQNMHQLLELKLVAKAILLYPTCLEVPEFFQKISRLWEEKTSQHDLLK